MSEPVSIVSSEYASSYAEAIMLTSKDTRLAEAQVWATLAVAAAIREKS